jgi:hypothetical protein
MVTDEMVEAGARALRDAYGGTWQIHTRATRAVLTAALADHSALKTALGEKL